MHLTDQYYPEAKFGGFTAVDGTVAFYTRINSLVEPDHVVLDIGCGRGGFSDRSARIHRNLRQFKGRVRQVIGIDVDPAGEENPLLDTFRLIDGPRWPVESASVQVAYSDWTVEHIDDPDTFFEECYRVLSPGGYLCVRTTNRLSYVGILSTLIPNRLHDKTLKVAQPSRQTRDVFPTVYRANTVRQLRGALERAGFEHCVYGHDAEPSYLHFSRVAYLMGMLHQKLAPAYFKPALFAFARKPVVAAS